MEAVRLESVALVMMGMLSVLHSRELEGGVAQAELVRQELRESPEEVLK